MHLFWRLLPYKYQLPVSWEEVSVGGWSSMTLALPVSSVPLKQHQTRTSLLWRTDPVYLCQPLTPPKSRNLHTTNGLLTPVAQFCRYKVYLTPCHFLSKSAQENRFVIAVKKWELLLLLRPGLCTCFPICFLWWSGSTSWLFHLFCYKLSVLPPCPQQQYLKCEKPLAVWLSLFSFQIEYFAFVFFCVHCLLYCLTYMHRLCCFCGKICVHEKQCKWLVCLKNCDLNLCCSSMFSW